MYCGSFRFATDWANKYNIFLELYVGEWLEATLLLYISLKELIGAQWKIINSQNVKFKRYYTGS